MELTWDEQKNGKNIAKHAFDFSDAAIVFQSKLFVRQDRRKEYGEDRYQGIGKIHNVLVVIVFTIREPETIRIISLRKANRNERKIYEEALKIL
ncbi:MAG: BrnT family toxin [Gammaproteobacteria bacterium]|nr:BrnT family toxin [Gammaproteobacteria bacterium]